MMANAFGPLKSSLEKRSNEGKDLVNTPGNVSRAVDTLTYTALAFLAGVIVTLGAGYADEEPAICTSLHQQEITTGRK